MDFKTTIGHEKQKKLFEQVIKNGRLAHAYVLVGPEYVGKTTFALDLAKALLADPVMDTVFLDNQEGINIEEARDLAGRLSLAPMGSLKVAIVTYADRMSQEAANSLLKTLEEPPARSVLFLVTSNFYALLPTIASRVQRINFGLAEKEEISGALANFDLDLDLKKQINELALGRIGFAKKLATDPKLLEFYKASEKNYQVLKSGLTFDRLVLAQKLAELENSDLEDFFKFAARKYLEDPGDPSLGRRILRAFEDLRYNLNTKLLLDNLFLP